jgi:small subunit ribosomal protein S6
VRQYELVFVVHPELETEDLSAVVERVEDLVKRSGGQVIRIEPWGLRRLAYPIQNRWEGQYLLMRLELDPPGVADLERRLRLTEQIMRHLIVRVEGETEEDTSEEEVAT